MQTVFVIDTAMDACQIGLFGCKDGSVYAIDVLSERMARGHQEFIGPAVLQCFGKNGIDPRDVSVFGVTLGPGSFTGLRVGLSYAKGLAVGTGARLRGFSTLELIGRAARFADQPRLVAHDAGRGQVYVQYLSHDNRADAPVSYDIEQIDQIDVAETPAFVIGSGATLLSARFPQSKIVLDSLPDLSAMAALCLAETTAYDDLTPLYMRDADAKVSDKAIIKFPQI
ncbi:MAG: tRNA (adenosine(37)-N6)-threonylcarbamoyltransferase complex dimerization subunit type 1 TsaB [Asticcacaulis sp.]